MEAGVGPMSIVLVEPAGRMLPPFFREVSQGDVLFTERPGGVDGLFPAQHWRSITTGSPIESTSESVIEPSDQRAVCHGTACYTWFKLGMCVQKNWRRLRGFKYLAPAITGVKFKDGIEVKPVDQVIA